MLLHNEYCVWIVKENPFSDGPFLCRLKINYIRWLSGYRKWWSWQINPREQTHKHKHEHTVLWLTVGKNIHQSDWNYEKCLTACHFPTPILSSARTHIVIWNNFTNLSSSCPCLDWSVFTYYRRNYSAVIMIVNQAWRDANMKLCLVGFCHLLVQMYNCK